MTGFATTPKRIAPASYREAPNLFKRAGMYYLMYSVNDTRSVDYQVDYATSTSPLGPFTKAVYHRFRIPGGDGTHREVCIDRMTFAADGSINTIHPILAGISPVTP